MDNTSIILYYALFVSKYHVHKTITTQNERKREGINYFN